MLLDLRSIAAALGGEVFGGQVLAPGPDHSANDRSLSVKLNDAGEIVVHSFSPSDDPIACKDYVRAKCGLPAWQPGQGNLSERASAAQPRQRVETPTKARKDKPKESAENTPRALEIFAEAYDLVKKPLAMRFLEVTRRIKGRPPNVHEVLRFHPSCLYGPCERPCLVALVRNVITNKPQAIYRTTLTPDGQKLERARAFGPTGGGAIKLWPDEDVELGLVVGEGLETTLAAAMMIEHRGTLLRPAWALGSSGNLANFPVLPGVEAITILVDHDENNAGQEAAAECAKRWTAARREVIRLTPREVGADFNNIIEGEAP